MKFELVATSRFKRDLKAMIKRNANIGLMNDVVEMLLDGKTLPEKYHDHNLTGDWKGHRECHIEPDWLLIYRQDKDILVLTLTRTGSHSDLLDR